MDDVFLYWDNSNVFVEAQRLAEERDEGPNARYRVRINFDNLLRLAQADRPLKKAFAAGSVPPQMRQQARLEGGDSLVGELLQPADARVGREERRVHRA